MTHWNLTKIEPAPDKIEVLLSDGKYIYLGTYDCSLDVFFDQNNFCFQHKPKYWHELPELP